MLRLRAACEAGIPRKGWPQAVGRRPHTASCRLVRSNAAAARVGTVWSQLQRCQQPLHRAAKHRAARAVLPRTGDEHQVANKAPALAVELLQSVMQAVHSACNLAQAADHSAHHHGIGSTLSAVHVATQQCWCAVTHLQLRQGR